MEKPIIHSGKVTKQLLTLNFLVAIVYIGWWFNFSHAGNIYLYGLLLFGEVYHVLLSSMFWFTIWPSNSPTLNTQNSLYRPTIDVFITVAGEPVGIIARTIRKAKQMTYPEFSIYVLNDGYVAGKENWRAIEVLCDNENVKCVTRKEPGGAKAGNINNALRQTSGEIIVVFDADMQPYKDFLTKTIPYFQDERVGFVQSPQYYKNSYENRITAGSWEQQEFFFGPIMRGKEKSNASFICGTNFAIRRQTIMDVGGMNEDNIAEDFLTSLAIHSKKWVSYYVPEVLATGLAPRDLLSYYNQQLRWARGSLEVLFGQNPIFKRGLNFRQKIEYLSSALFYFNGVVIAIDMIIPLLSLVFGFMPVQSTTTSFALFFIPFIVLNLYTIFNASEGFLTFRAISFTQSSWTLQLQALFSVLLRRKMEFRVTAKDKISGNFRRLVYPHLAYVALTIIAGIIGISREGLTPSIITNIAWAAFNSIMFMSFIHSSFQKAGHEDVLDLTKMRRLSARSTNAPSYFPMLWNAITHKQQQV
jgi:cellulose synthase (UDP-forming)